MTLPLLRLFARDPEIDGRSVATGMVLLLVGGALTGTLALHLARQPWDLSGRGVEVTSIARGHSVLTGDFYTIEAGGRRHVCHRGMNKLAKRVPVAVLHDPGDPSRCRALDTAARLGDYERQGLLVAAALLLGGLGVVLAWRAEPRPRWRREAPASVLRPRLLMLARVVFVLGLGLGLAVPAFVLSSLLRG